MFDGQPLDGRDPRKAKLQELATDPAVIEELYRNNYFAAQCVFVQLFANHLKDVY